MCRDETGELVRRERRSAGVRHQEPSVAGVQVGALNVDVDVVRAWLLAHRNGEHLVDVGERAGVAVGVSNRRQRVCRRPVAAAIRRHVDRACVCHGRVERPAEAVVAGDDVAMGRGDQGVRGIVGVGKLGQAHR